MKWNDTEREIERETERDRESERELASHIISFLEFTIIHHQSHRIFTREHVYTASQPHSLYLAYKL